VEDSLAAYLAAAPPALVDSVYPDSARPLWVDGGGLTEVGTNAVSRIESAEREGLQSARYGLETIRRLADRAQGAPSQAERVGHLARLDAELTGGLALLTRDLAHGRLPAEGFEPGWRVDSTDAALPAVTDGQALLRHLDSVRPAGEQYERLVSLRARLDTVAQEGGWPDVPAGDTVLAVGDSAELVSALRARLRRSLSAEERRLVDPEGAHPAVMDSSLVEALTLFQERHDLAADELLGPATLAALGVSAAERADEVAVALERWRWLPARLGTPAVLVNTPARRLHVLEEGAERMTMKVVIGERDWETALFQDAMERMVVNPWWNVPTSIFEAETLPKAREDPGYLRRNDFEVVDPETGDTVPLASISWDEVEAGSFPYRVRQGPGPGNALGAVKFLFPNRHAIYLHDTPADHLFDERMRTFSHGCVRVEEPARLARYLLRTVTEEPPSRYEELEATDERHVIPLERHVSTYIVYQTVWVDDEGTPTFTPDVYDRNGRVRSALARADLPARAPSEER
jgi:murein L,D-transpeptidase YcbB/YkuD